MPQTVAFTKGHGTGNDFVVIPDPDGELDLTDDQVAVLCDRRFGIGARRHPPRRAVDARSTRARMPRPPAPSGSWTTATPTARRRRCAATASASSRATSPTPAGRPSTTAPLADRHPRRRARPSRAATSGFEVDLGPVARRARRRARARPRPRRAAPGARHRRRQSAHRRRALRHRRARRRST